MLVDYLQFDRDQLAGVCRRYGVERLEVFGSFTRGETEAESDLDVLVSFSPGPRVGLEFVALQQELGELFGRPVDLLTRKSVEGSPNKYLRRFALSHTEPIYESA